MAILNTRRKWRATKENLKSGEFVLVVIRMLHVVNGIGVEWYKFPRSGWTGARFPSEHKG